MITISTSSIITAASLIVAIGTIGGVIFSIYRWYLKQNHQDEEIKKLKKEQTLLCYGMLACLEGLKQQGCNGPVTEARDKLSKHLNEHAHD